MSIIGVLVFAAVLLLAYIMYNKYRVYERMASDSVPMVMLKNYGFALMDYMRHNQTDKYDRSSAAKLIAGARRRNLISIDSMDGKILTLLSRYNPAVLREVTRGADGSTSTTYDKGRGMDLCLRDIDGKIHDDNLLKFVFTHELAHIMTHESQHPSVFWMNFKYLLEVAVDAKLYTPYDFSKKPIQYCGMMVNHSPLFDDRIPSFFTQYITEKCGGAYTNCAQQNPRSVSPNLAATHTRTVPRRSSSATSRGPVHHGRVHWDKPYNII